ncbi:aluminum-activated malate transporter 8-like [Heracleum sosnowskyi]|uniref:Aluminum-activated malate transporter 8-like n=1 Tax=Heracleum sosnowskyi TaxID=360622 RepID=A0AAD8NCE7_9APIA|nr:aluminum-activated malate transporter 8-like [Heracleum sosnowskyi]
MEIDSTTCEQGLRVRLCDWTMALFGKIGTNVGKVVDRIMNLARDDPRRVIHSFKVALALTFVSLIYYIRPLYDGFGVAGIWAVLTVVVIFEFTVGGTLCKGINRGIATFSAGGLGLGANYIASHLGKEGEPVFLAFLVFLLAAVSTFIRFFPHIKRRYDYGVLIFILTFSMVAVSGYRVEKIIELANQRLFTIIIGGATCMVVSLFLCPVWAGEDLHKLIALNMEKLASFLEGFGDEYFKLHEEESSRDDDACSKNKLLFLHGYKSVLNSKASEESLANFAWWEPGHGKFKFSHPWKLYLKTGVLIRQCAYHIEALNGYLNTDVQVQSEFHKRIAEPCMKMSSESGKALKELASSLRAMKRPSTVSTHIKNCEAAISDLRVALEASSPDRADIVEIIPSIAVGSLLNDITKCVGKISESIHELSDKACFESPKSTLSSHIIHRGTVKPVSGDSTHGNDENHVNVVIVNSSSLGHSP